MRWVSNWRRAWFKDSSGDLFPGHYRIAGDRCLLMSQTGKHFEGYRDGKTSWGTTEWFAEQQTGELLEWKGEPLITSKQSVCRHCGN